MKQKEILIVGLTAFVTALFAFLLSGVLFGSPKKNPIKVPVVEKISSEFPSPQTDPGYSVFFNDKAINPTQLIQIGGSNNTAPFQSSNQ